MEIDPENVQFKQNLQSCKDEMKAANDPMGSMFGPQAMVKLMANPRTAKYFEDPQFRNMFEMCKQQPQMLMQLMQSDPRFMEIFQVLTGIDLMKMQEDQMQNKEMSEEMKKKAEAERKM